MSVRWSPAARKSCASCRTPPGSRSRLMCEIATSASSASGRRLRSRSKSFPFTRYGVIKAHVVRIARDAIPEPDAGAIEGDPARVSAAQGFAGGERTQNLVFPIVLKPDDATITVDGVASRSPPAWRSRSSSRPAPGGCSNTCSPRWSKSPPRRCGSGKADRIDRFDPAVGRCRRTCQTAPAGANSRRQRRSCGQTSPTKKSQN